MVSCAPHTEIKRTLSNKASVSAVQAPARPSSKAEEKHPQPAIVQYLDEHGNPAGAPVQMNLPGSSRSSSVASSARNSTVTSSNSSRRSSTSSLSSIETRHKDISRRGSKSSLAATSAVIGPSPQAEKPTVPVEEIKPAKFRNGQYVTDHKGKCENCSGVSKRLASISIVKSQHVSKIAKRPSIEALIKEQRASKHPRPACEHDEMTLEKYDEYGYSSSEAYIPQKTSKGELVWVFKEGSSRGWRDT